MARDGRPAHERWLNGATAVLLVAAGGLLVRDRLIPAWQQRQVVAVGETVPAGLSLVTLAARDTVPLGRLRPSLLLYFQSGCPACTRNLPAWQRLLEERPRDVRVVAVGLEAPAAALGYVRRELPGALAVRPEDRAGTLRLLDVEAVPTTQLVDGDGRLLVSRTGVLTPAEVHRILDRASGAAGGSDPSPSPRPGTSNNGRRP